MISRAGRVAFAGDDLLSGTAEEKAGAVESFVAYAGRYTIHGDQVVHHVEVSLFPNWGEACIPNRRNDGWRSALATAWKSHPD